MADGWIKLHRKVQDNPVWGSEKFSKGHAWVDLLMLANHRKDSIMKRGIVVNLERGDVGYSEDFLANRWRWSRGKIRRFIALLSSHKMVQKISSGNTSVSVCIRIVNYEQYQGTTKETVQKTEQKMVQKAVQKTVQEQECKEEKEVLYGDSRYSKNFEIFWKSYPNKQGKAKAFTSWKKHNCENGKFEAIMKSLSDHKNSKEWRKEGGQYIPHGGTWVYNQRWEDDVETGDRDDWGA